MKMAPHSRTVTPVISLPQDRVIDPPASSLDLGYRGLDRWQCRSALAGLVPSGDDNLELCEVRVVAEHVGHGETRCDAGQVPDRVLDCGLEPMGFVRERRLVLYLHLQLHLLAELSAEHLQELGNLIRDAQSCNRRDPSSL